MVYIKDPISYKSGVSNYDVEIDISYVLNLDSLDGINKNSPIKYIYLKDFLDKWLNFIKYSYVWDCTYTDTDGTNKKTISMAEAAAIYETLVRYEILINPVSYKRKMVAERLNR